MGKCPVLVLLPVEQGRKELDKLVSAHGTRCYETVGMLVVAFCFFLFPFLANINPPGLGCFCSTR